MSRVEENYLERETEEPPINHQQTHTHPKYTKILHNQTLKVSSSKDNKTITTTGTITTTNTTITSSTTSTTEVDTTRTTTSETHSKDTTNESLSLDTRKISKKEQQNDSKSTSPVSVNPPKPSSPSSTSCTTNNNNKKNSPIVGSEKSSGKFLKNIWSFVKDSNMLFRLGLQSKSPVDSLLEKEHCSLEEILDEDSVVQEAKAHNSKLIAFLNKVENVTKLVEYITVELKLDYNTFRKSVHYSSSSPFELSSYTMNKKEPNIQDSMDLSSSPLGKQLLDQKEEKNEERNDEIYSTIPNNDHKEEQTSSENASQTKNNETEDLEENSVRLDEEKLEKRIHKFPRLAAEILCSDIDELYASIVGDRVLLSTLMGFLQQEPPLNSKLAEYWVKVMRCLLQRRIFDIMKYIITQREEFAQCFINHLNILGMDDLLLKLTGCDITISRKDISINDVSKWWADCGLIEKLLALLDPKFDAEVHAGVVKILSEIIKRSTSLSLDLQRTNVLAASILSEKNLLLLMDALMKNCDSVLIETLPLLTTMIEISFDIMSAKNNNSTSSEDEDEEYTNDSSSSSNKDVNAHFPAPLHIIMSRIPQFIHLLKHPPPMERLELTFGVLDPPLGEARLRVIEFLISLYHYGFQPINNELIRHQVLSVIFDLFFKYEYNNILHNLVLRSVNFVLASENFELKRSLFQDVKILERILEANRLNEHSRLRKGYMGHLTVISNSIVTVAKSQSNVAELIQETPGWKEFVENGLAERNNMELKPIDATSSASNHSSKSSMNAVLDEEQQQELEKQFQEFELNVINAFDNDGNEYDDEGSSSSSSDEEDNTMVKKQIDIKQEKSAEE
jgi:serine/threonine-protein phosphatase 6 regulatory subunit 3